jgi:hypothetical protein
MTEVKLTSAEYEKLYSVYCAASNLVNYNPSFIGTEVDDWITETYEKRLKEAVQEFKNQI